MAKDQACKLQILSAEHRGLLLAVDTMFDKFRNSRQVQQMIEREYHIVVGITAIQSYKKNHYNVQKRMFREQKDTFKGLAEIIGEDGLDMAVNALLWQELQEMTPTQLIAFRKVLNDSAKVALMKKHLALQAKEHRQKMKERREAAAKAGEEFHDDPVENYAKAQHVVAQVKEIFGIGMSEAPRPAPKMLGPAPGMVEQAPPPAPNGPLGS